MQLNKKTQLVPVTRLRDTQTYNQKQSPQQTKSRAHQIIADISQLHLVDENRVKTVLANQIMFR